MPELPEVQSFADALNKNYSGKILSGISLHRSDIRFPLEVDALLKVFSRGQKLLKVWREGKQLIFETSAGSVNVSLGMSGAFFPATVGSPRRHEHITLLFDRGEGLAFVDPRRFGFWKIRSENQTSSINYKIHSAADPLNEAALVGVFKNAKLQKSMRTVKDVLMDQSWIGGIGNIYALEALFRAGLHPQKSCAEISSYKKGKKWNDLARCIPVLLTEAISEGGSSISTYRKLHGDSGNFQKLHRVYGRHGDPCLAANCTGIIERFVQGGRSSWVCLKCQPKVMR